MYQRLDIKTILPRYASKEDYAEHIDLETAGRKRIVASLRDKLEFPVLFNKPVFHNSEFSREEVYLRLSNAQIFFRDRAAIFELLTDSTELYFQTIFGNHKALQLKQTDTGLYVPEYVRRPEQVRI